MTITDQKIKLIEGTFTPSEASDILNTLIKKKINFHKLQRLSITEKNCDDNTGHLDGRIDELLDAEKSLKQIIAEAREDGFNLQIESDVYISFVKSC